MKAAIAVLLTLFLCSCAAPSKPVAVRSLPPPQIGATDAWVPPSQ